MPSVDAPPEEMDALIAYLESLGKSAESRATSTSPVSAGQPNENGAQPDLANSSSSTKAAKSGGAS